jgi:two-component system, cell cycle sensor histidine kinase and response regulator CckA
VAAQQHIRILMVEDNPLDAELIERELRRSKLDFSSRVVHLEQKFRQALESSDPDVILCDYNLPGFDAVAALKIAMSLVPDTPFIFVSGSIGEERAVQTLREGATDYILKDRLSRLPSAITRALDQKRDRKLRRRAQEALERSEERFQFAAKATQEVIRDRDMAADKIWFSDAIRTAWGHSLENGIAPVEWWEQRIHPQDRSRVLKSLHASIDGEERWTAAYRFERGDGTYGPVIDRGLIIRSSSGKATRMICAMEDMTDRTAAADTIERLSRQNWLILEYAAEGIYAMSRDEVVLSANPAASAMTGYSNDELRSATNIHELIHHSRADGSPYPIEECPMHQTMLDGVVRISEDFFWRKSGEHFQVDFSCSPIYERDAIVGAVVMFQDATERRRLEKQVEQATRVTSLGRVAATIAHEFNNVLMGIQPFAEVIRRNSGADEKNHKAADQILGSVKRGKRVTEEILRFTQPAEPVFQTIVLADWLRQLEPELTALVGHRVTIAIQNGPRPVVARCDPTQLQQVLTNLVLNARDAMPSGGAITIITADASDREEYSFGQIPDGRVLLAVRDTGSGMLPKVRDSIFEPLFTTKRSGTGLGLAVAKQVIERHGGTIHVDTAPGQGTTFFVLLPSEEKRAPREAEQNDGKRTSARRVLLVEDEPAVAAGVIAILEEEGIEVHAVERGTEAPDAAESFRPDAVILDLRLPDISGLDVYAALKTIDPDLPIIFSSGHADRAVLEAQLDSASLVFLRKPYEVDALLAALERAMQERRRVEPQTAQESS